MLLFFGQHLHLGIPRKARRMIIQLPSLLMYSSLYVTEIYSSMVPRILHLFIVLRKTMESYVALLCVTRDTSIRVQNKIPSGQNHLWTKPQRTKLPL